MRPLGRTLLKAFIRTRPLLEIGLDPVLLDESIHLEYAFSMSRPKVPKVRSFHDV